MAWVGTDKRETGRWGCGSEPPTSSHADRQDSGVAIGGRDYYYVGRKYQHSYDSPSIVVCFEHKAIIKEYHKLREIPVQVARALSFVELGLCAHSCAPPAGLFATKLISAHAGRVCMYTTPFFPGSSISFMWMRHGLS